MPGSCTASCARRGDIAIPRRPDTDKFVTWEVAGASHSDYHNYVYGAPVRARDLGVYGYVYAPPNNPNCVLPSRTQVDYYKVIQAAFDHTIRWVTQGSQPPAAPSPIQVTTTTPRRAVRDSYGIALGGIRLDGVDVPVGFNAGWQLGVTPVVELHLPAERHLYRLPAV